MSRVLLYTLGNMSTPYPENEPDVFQTGGTPHVAPEKEYHPTKDFSKNNSGKTVVMPKVVCVAFHHE